MAELRVGTSGWIYKHWAKDFYPEGTRAGGHLLHYATLFDTVEINGSFYKLPTLAASRGWYKAVPDDFLFAVKGSRWITHMKKLRVSRASIAIFFRRIAPLKHKTGTILGQLPPQLAKDTARLDDFLAMLPARLRYAVEFRHPSWYEDDEALDVLARRNVAHVCTSSRIMPPRREVTADFTYIRFHGLSGFDHDYTSAELAPWAEFAGECLESGVSVYAYFNNDENARAPRNAVQLRTMVQLLRREQTSPPPKRSRRPPKRPARATLRHRAG